MIQVADCGTHGRQPRSVSVLATWSTEPCRSRKNDVPVFRTTRQPSAVKSSSRLISRLNSRCSFGDGRRRTRRAPATVGTPGHRPRPPGCAAHDRVDLGLRQPAFHDGQPQQGVGPGLSARSNQSESLAGSAFSAAAVHFYAFAELFHSHPWPVVPGFGVERFEDERIADRHQVRQREQAPELAEHARRVGQSQAAVRCHWVAFDPDPVEGAVKVGPRSRPWPKPITAWATVMRCAPEMVAARYVGVAAWDMVAGDRAWQSSCPQTAGRYRSRFAGIGCSSARARVRKW